MNLSTYQAHLSVRKNNEVIFVKCFEPAGKEEGVSSVERIISWKHLSIELFNNSAE